MAGDDQKYTAGWSDGSAEQPYGLCLTADESNGSGGGERVLLCADEKNNTGLRRITIERGGERLLQVTTVFRCEPIATPLVRVQKIVMA